MTWFALYTKPKHEKKVTEQLHKAGIEVYCPMMTQIKQWSDRRKKVEVPLISSYVFVNIEEKNRNDVFYIPGVVRYLFWLGKPAIIREVEILALKEGLEKMGSSVEVSRLKIGDSTTITEGPFKGKEGVLKQIRNSKLHLVLKELGILIILNRR